MKWYDAKEVAALLNMTSRALRAYIKAGVFPVGARGGRYWSQEEVDWMSRALSFDGRLGMLARMREELATKKVGK